MNERRSRNVYFVQLILTSTTMAKGWAAFAEAHRALRGTDPGKLAYCRHTVTPVGVTAVFEVLP